MKNKNVKTGWIWDFWICARRNFFFLRTLWAEIFDLCLHATTDVWLQAEFNPSGQMPVGGWWFTVKDCEQFCPDFSFILFNICIFYFSLLNKFSRVYVKRTLTGESSELVPQPSVPRTLLCWPNQRVSFKRTAVNSAGSCIKMIPRTLPLHFLHSFCIIRDIFPNSCWS